MKANPGDRLIVEGRTDTAHRREGQIIEVHGDDGSPPYLVKWDDGHEGTVYPGPDAHVVAS